MQPRFRTQDTVYAVLRPEFAPIGRVRNISAKGLALEYLADDLEMAPFTHVDIFTRPESVYIGEIPCRLVYDLPDTNHPGSPFLGPVHRVCGLSFTALSPDQEIKLRHFMEHHTVADTAEA